MSTYDVFISHKWENKLWVLTLANNLKTFDEKNTRLDRIIVYGMIEKERFTMAELLTFLEKITAAYPPEEIRQSLTRLELAFIVWRKKQCYFWCVPLFREMVSEQEPRRMIVGEIRGV